MVVREEVRMEEGKAQVMAVEMAGEDRALMRRQM